MPQLVALMPSMIETMKNMKNMTLTMYQSQKGQQDQMKALQENSTAMGQAFDASKNDDSFYLPPEVFDQPRLQARHEDVRLTGRQGGPVHHLP